MSSALIRAAAGKRHSILWIPPSCPSMACATCVATDQWSATHPCRIWSFVQRSYPHISPSFAVSFIPGQLPSSRCAASACACVGVQATQDVSWVCHDVTATCLCAQESGSSSSSSSSSSSGGSGGAAIAAATAAVGVVEAVAAEAAAVGFVQAATWKQQQWKG